MPRLYSWVGGILAAIAGITYLSLLWCLCDRNHVHRKATLCQLPCQSVVCAGAKKREDLYQAFENIYPVLKQYRKGDAAPHKPRKQNPAKTLTVKACLKSCLSHGNTGIGMACCCMCTMPAMSRHAAGLVHAIAGVLDLDACPRT